MRAKSNEMTLTSMDNTSRSRRLDALTDGPLSHFITARCEETSQIQRLAHRRDHLGKTRLGVQLLAFLLCLGIVTKLRQSFFERCGNGDDWIPR